MNIKEIVNFQPHYSNCESPEPSLNAILCSYYAEHFSTIDSLHFAQEYIDALEKEYED